MAAPRFLLIPDEESYNVVRGSGAISNQLKGGKGRYRLDELAVSSMVPMQFTLDPVQYTYAMAFYRMLLEGSTGFQIQLIGESAYLQWYSANIVPGTWKLNSIEGMTYIIGCTLEVIPIDDSNADQDFNLVAQYAGFTGIIPIIDSSDGTQQSLRVLGGQLVYGSTSITGNQLVLIQDSDDPTSTYKLIINAGSLEIDLNEGEAQPFIDLMDQEDNSIWRLTVVGGQAQIAQQ